ncbi:MAG TPA: GlsB/YeaQ/YmgE family stress response membrane protein [Gemmatimonadaceae bacterium]
MDSISFLTWIVLGLVCGAIAKALMPGPDPGGIVVTIIIGVIGAIIGGTIGKLAFNRGISGFDLRSVILAIVGSLILLWIYRLANRSRTNTTRTP